MEFESTKEVLIVSDCGNKESTCTMYDLENETVIETYKDGVSVRNGVHLIGYDYLISASGERPKLKIWQLGHSATVHYQMTVPGIVSALAVSRNGLYCVAGIGTAVYVWEVATGNMDGHIECHSQNITCIKFTSDDSHFITGGKDGFVFVISLAETIEYRESALDIPEVRYSWRDHAAEVTDIHTGSMGMYGRVATVSRDETCRIYELDTGFNLHIIKMPAPLTAVTMDRRENFLYLGSKKGDLYNINLFKMDKTEMIFDDIENKHVHHGHRKEITSLIISQSGKYLLSGSVDQKVIVWDIKNFNIANVLNFQGTITNIITSEIPPGIKDRKYLSRHFVATFRTDMNKEESTPVNIIDRDLSLFHSGSSDEFFDSSVLNLSMDDLEKRLLLRSMTFDDMSRINHEIFTFALSENFQKSSEGECGSSSAN